MRAGTSWIRWFPGIRVLLTYDRSWLRHDLVAGLVMTTMLVPVGIAYAEASGLPGSAGLYATMVPLLVYALFGPSRILVLGPDSAIVAVTLAVVLPFSGGDPDRALDAGGMMALIAGIACLATGLSRFGFITELLSKPIRHGYMNGIAVSVILSQIPKLLGFSSSGNGPLSQIWTIGERIAAGSTNPAALAVGGTALALILLLKRYPRVPGMLVAVTVTTMIVAVFDLDSRTGISVLGSLPQGLPLPRVPTVPFAELRTILIGGAAAALIAFADTSVLSRAYAARLKTPVDPNQEMFGLGLANVAAGFFQGFPVSGSTSRTPVAEAAGARTQLTGVVGAVAIGLLLLFGPELLHYLPQTALAAIVIASAIGLIEVKDLSRIYRIQRWEFWLSMTCFAGVAIFGAIPGILLAITIAVIEFLWDGWRPHSAVLGVVDHLRGYHDITRHPGARLIPGLVLFRWDAPLFFANAEFFHDRVLAAVRSSPTPVRRLVVAAEPVTSIDVTSADALCELDDALKAAGVRMCFAEVKDPVMEKFKRFGLMNRFDRSAFFATIEEAVDAFETDAAQRTGLAAGPTG